MTHVAKVCYAGVMFIVAVTLSSCIGSSYGTIAVLATDLPNIVSYVDHYNAVSETYKVAVTYVENPAQATPEQAPDLIAGFNLNGTESIRRFSEIGSVLESIGAAEFYREFLRLGVYEEKQLLLPLSFTLPICIIRIDDAEVLPSSSILDVDDLRVLSAEYTGEKRVGFSPRLEPSTAYLFTRFFDVDFRESEQSVPKWNELLLRETVAYVAAWSAELNHGIDAEDAFIDKYLYDPPYRLVADMRIRFAFSTLDEYLNVPAEIGERLDFRWPSRGDSVYVEEDPVFIGRTRESRNRKASIAFLSWLFRQETQSELLEIDRYRRVRGFGIVGGFSALKSVNNDELVRLYPFLRGRIPTEANLNFPARLPASWPSIREEVIYPWMTEASATPSEAEPLADALLEWLRLRPGSTAQARRN